MFLISSLEIVPVAHGCGWLISVAKIRFGRVGFQGKYTRAATSCCPSAVEFGTGSIQKEGNSLQFSPEKIPKTSVNCLFWTFNHSIFSRQRLQAASALILHRAQLLHSKIESELKIFKCSISAIIQSKIRITIRSFIGPPPINLQQWRKSGFQMVSDHVLGY